MKHTESLSFSTEQIQELKVRYGLNNPVYRVQELPHNILPIGLTSIYAEVKAGRLRISKCGKASFAFADDLVLFLEGLRTPSERAA